MELIELNAIAAVDVIVACWSGVHADVAWDVSSPELFLQLPSQGTRFDIHLTQWPMLHVAS